jgi:outer membrane protein assembly factor BamB
LRIMKIASFLTIFCVLGGVFLSGTRLIYAQDQCGVLDSVAYPVDLNAFQLGQDFGIASPRHEGRYHTGEDWFVGRGATLDQPVRAIGRGVVTFSNPQAWGADGGVIIIRHTLPDGATVYSQYGHLAESGGVTFPARLACVDSGEIIGIVTNSAPAPHLHFEMRVPTTDNPGVSDTPGQRYTRQDPRLLGWRRPSQMLRNLQARLIRGSAWYSVTATFNRPAPPLVLNDNSLLVIDGDRLRRVTSDGRVMWRVALARPAVSLHGQFSQSYVTYADGSVVVVNVETGGLSDGWRVEGFLPDMSPLLTESSRIYHTQDNSLVALDLNQRDVLWRVENIPQYDYGWVSPLLIGLVMGDELWTLRVSDGERVNVVTLANGASLASHPDGTLLAYTQGGLWRIDANGEWSLVHEEVRGNTSGHGVMMRSDGRLYVTDGATLRSYLPDGAFAWESRLPQRMAGRVNIEASGGVLIITSTHGDILIMQDGGGVCGYTAVYGNDQAHAWHTLGADGMLRVSVGDQLMGFDWGRFAGGC